MNHAYSVAQQHERKRAYALKLVGDVERAQCAREREHFTYATAICAAEILLFVGIWFASLFFGTALALLGAALFIIFRVHAARFRADSNASEIRAGELRKRFDGVLNGPTP